MSRDATCTDTFAASHLTLAAREARAVAALAEERKRVKYLDLAQTHHFVAVVVETTGAMGTDALDFLQTLENKSGRFLMKRSHVLSSCSRSPWPCSEATLPQSWGP